MKVLFFAHLRELSGLAEAELAEDAVDAGRLWEILLERWPALAGARSQVRLARNGVYVSPDERFLAGDEIALIPPVSGG
ncbi:MAG: MoaD/ThiS family protein [Chthoniobacterales bacterium]|nr:MoaD/ThiS family protein [Chthoniobacterales bacterium]